MAKYKYIYLAISIFSFLLQLFDIVTQSVSFSMTITFLLVVIQIACLLQFAYLHKDSVRNKKRFIDFIQIIVFLIYLLNLTYELFLNPGIRHVADTAYDINVIPLHTISLFIQALLNGSLGIKNVFLNLIGNITLFIPLGYFLVILFKECRKFSMYLFTSFVIISFVELGQVYFRVGTGDIDDVILNLSGVILFFIIYKIPFIKKNIESMKVR